MGPNPQFPANLVKFTEEILIEDVNMLNTGLNVSKVYNKNTRIASSDAVLLSLYHPCRLSPN